MFGENGLMTVALYFFFTDIKFFTPSQSLFLIGFVALAKSVSEVPTGIFADKISRKFSITLGYIVLLASWLGIVFASNFWVIIFLTLGRGIGAGFISGADIALIYDSLKEIGESDRFKSVYSLSQSIELLFFGITVLAGGFLAGISLYLPISGHIFLILMSLIISLMLVEPKVTKTGEKIEKYGYVIHAFLSLKTIFSAKGFLNGLTIAFVSFALISAVFRSTKNILSPILDQYGTTLAWMGAIIAVIVFIKAAGAFIASKINKKGGEMREVAFSLAFCVGGLFIILFSDNSWVKLITFALIISLDNVILAGLKTIINERIESSRRSTILSLLSLFSKSSEMVFLTTFGWLINVRSVDFAIFFTTLWLGLALIVMYRFFTFRASDFH
jgi:MFS family permease